MNTWVRFDEKFADIDSLDLNRTSWRPQKLCIINRVNQNVETESKFEKRKSGNKFAHFSLQEERKCQFSIIFVRIEFVENIHFLGNKCFYAFGRKTKTQFNESYNSLINCQWRKKKIKQVSHCKRKIDILPSPTIKSGSERLRMARSWKLVCGLSLWQPKMAYNFSLRDFFFKYFKICL